jgi:hypothetical protein
MVIVAGFVNAVTAALLCRFMRCRGIKPGQIMLAHAVAV